MWEAVDDDSSHEVLLTEDGALGGFPPADLITVSACGRMITEETRFGAFEEDTTFYVAVKPAAGMHQHWQHPSEHQHFSSHLHSHPSEHQHWQHPSDQHFSSHLHSHPSEHQHCPIEYDDAVTAEGNAPPPDIIGNLLQL